jgi:hypothetical protein
MDDRKTTTATLLGWLRGPRGPLLVGSVFSLSFAVAFLAAGEPAGAVLVLVLVIPALALGNTIRSLQDRRAARSDR